MLVLSRKRFEKIQIGENIVVKVIKTGKSAVKIGIEAPQDVRVVRSEICEAAASPPLGERLRLVGANKKETHSLSAEQIPHAV